MSEIEKRVCKGCCLGISGVKVASLYSVQPSLENIDNVIQDLNAKLSSIGSRFEMLHKNERRILIFAFNQEKLKEHLKQKRNKKFLAQYGYSECVTIEEHLNRLRERIEVSGKGFPHEIGIFLGYPIEDIVGFIKNPTKHKVVGIWKVYKNVRQKLELFDKYQKAKKYYEFEIEKTDNIENVFMEA